MATFTLSKPLLRTLEFWHSALGLGGSVVPAAYNQVSLPRLRETARQRDLNRCCKSLLRRAHFGRHQAMCS